MAKRSRSQTHFTPEDCTRSKLQKGECADVEIEETARAPESPTLEQLVNDRQLWINEMNDRHDRRGKGFDYVARFIKRAKEVFEATEEPLYVDRLCLANRDKFFGIDLVYDDFQEELVKEVKTIEAVRSELRSIWEQLQEQGRLLASDQWQDVSDFSDSVATRSATMDSHLQKLENDMRRQMDNTNMVLAQRISKYKDEKEKCEDNLNRIITQIQEQEKVNTANSCMTVLVRNRMQSEIEMIDFKRLTDERCMNTRKNIGNGGCMPWLLC